MGVILGGLYHHQGYPDRRLLNGRLAGGVWIWSTRKFTAYVAACGCGWRASLNHPPTDQGAQAALDHWRDTHTIQLLDHKAPGHRGQLGRQLRWLGTQADRLQNPATLEDIREALEHARQLVADLQGDLERPAAAADWEVGGER
jgi:hypothetical protein